MTFTIRSEKGKQIKSTVLRHYNVLLFFSYCTSGTRLSLKYCYFSEEFHDFLACYPDVSVPMFNKTHKKSIYERL